jgi:hypothetical protein
MATALEEIENANVMLEDFEKSKCMLIRIMLNIFNINI